ncbi:DUF4314 domain-containing protein [Streptococcus oralis]|jgi:conserved domain protein|uniref:DUF4314 domain-containing protein n=1 Tax=Streptococcus oralis TaxID=1303 RepID=UPI00066DAB23|nr:DUF4314 domain-containing protein [Streptococcus oralis]
MNYKIKNEIKKKYPIGSIIKLIKMDDPYAPPIGTIGKIVDIDDIGSLLIRWENGSSLRVTAYDDKIEIVKSF